MFALLKDRNFRIFWFGQLMSVIGDHISLIAFPWLVLQLTGSAFLTAMTFAVQSIPRAVLMVLGGVVIDRFSPRAVMFATNVARLVVVSALSGLLYLDQVSADLVIVFALAFGIADAMFYPAEQAMVPSLVRSEELEAGNGMNQILIQIGIIFGPIIAGFVIAGELSVAGHGLDGAEAGAGYAEDRLGLARAFLIDAATFTLSLLSLLLIRPRKLGETEDKAPASMLADIREAFSFVRSVPAIRLAFIGVAMLEFCFQAPVFVGLPVLAKARFLDGAPAFALEVSAYGAGALIGGITAGSIKPVRRQVMVPLMFAVFAWSGATMGLAVLYEPLWWAMLVFFSSGLGDGFVWVQFTSWLQRLTPEAMIGRVMSFLMLMSVGLLPIAYMAIGALLEFGVERVLLATSAAIIMLSVFFALHPAARRVPDKA